MILTIYLVLVCLRMFLTCKRNPLYPHPFTKQLQSLLLRGLLLQLLRQSQHLRSRPLKFRYNQLRSLFIKHSPRNLFIKLRWLRLRCSLLLMSMKTRQQPNLSVFSVVISLKLTHCFVVSADILFQKEYRLVQVVASLSSLAPSSVANVVFA